MEEAGKYTEAMAKVTAVLHPFGPPPKAETPSSDTPSGDDSSSSSDSQSDSGDSFGDQMYSEVTDELCPQNGYQDINNGLQDGGGASGCF